MSLPSLERGEGLRLDMVRVVRRGKVEMSQGREVSANYLNTMLSQSYKNVRVIKNELHVKSILLLGLQGKWHGK